MQLGFVSAILDDLSLEEVFEFASNSGFDCVEIMCWPRREGKPSRRYADVTHIDVAGMDEARAADIRSLVDRCGVKISALGYYPNPLDPDLEARRLFIDHILTMIDAAKTRPVQPSRSRSTTPTLMKPTPSTSAPLR